MKDSGIEWIGEIPEEWKIVKVKDAFIRKNDKANTKNPTILTLARNGIKIRDISNNEGQLAADYSNYNPVDIDDLLLNPMDLISGDNCNISRVKGVISPAYINLRYRKGTNPELYNLYFKNLYWGNVLFAHGKGVSYENRWTLSYETLSQMKIPYPPSYEQDKIAVFLVDKLNKLEDIKSTIMKEIQTLKDYKKSVITEAVTKGLDKNVEMKDSGIEWIGKIPKHWISSVIKRFCNLKTGSTPNTNNKSWFDGKLNWFTPGDFNEKYILKNSRRKLSTKAKDDGVATIIESDSVLIVGIGATLGKIGYVSDECSCNQQVTSIKSMNLSNKFIMYWLISNTDFIRDNSNFTTLPILNNSSLGDFPLVSPCNLDEQQKIVRYLDNKCQLIDDSISIKKKQLETLEEYKKSLIYEYVTGKKEVKDGEES